MSTTISKNSLGPCSCCGAGSCGTGSFTRRRLFGGAAAAGIFPVLSLRARQAEGGHQSPIRKTLKVQPVFVYATPKRVEARSWRAWGGIQTEQDAASEKTRIGRELAALASPRIEFLPLAGIRTAQQATAITQGPQDVTLIYAAGGGINGLINPEKWNIVFVRHRSGPVYLWYEIAHPTFLRKGLDEYGRPGMDVSDVVVDSQSDLRLRLNALAAVKNSRGKRIVALGEPRGWGAGGRKAPDLAREIWNLDIQTVTYPDLSQMIQRARQNSTLIKKSIADADAFMKQKGVAVETSRDFVRNSFLLTEVFRQVLDQAQTDAITISTCMSTIMPMSETTACLPLMLLNDMGYLAFCESDFVVIPSGILLRYVADKPVFLNDPTYPHHGVVTLAHCTAPRRMDGDRHEPVRVLTHFESDYGAAPKVEMRKGQITTNLIPNFGGRDWVGFEGEIVDVPFLPICRSQIDVNIHGSCDKLVQDMRGFHWMTSYGKHLDECGYALKKLGIKLGRV